MDFPTAPVVGQRHPFTPTPGVPVFIWDGEKWTADPLTGAVRYDAAQSLTAPQQAQARENIAVTSGAPFESSMAYSGMQINGECSVNQAATGSIAAPGYFCDGWLMYKQGTMDIRAIQAAGGFPGFTYYLNFFVITAQTSLAASDQAEIYQHIEGCRIARLQWGSAAAQPITVAFWSSHVRTGTYSFAVRNGTQDRSYVTTYVQAVASTPQYNVITIPGCTTGTWDTSTGVGITLIFTIACGTTLTTSSPNTWLTSSMLAATGQANGVGATSDVFRITGVTVLPGTQAPTAAQSPNIMRSYDQEIETCRRYYQKFGGTYAADVLLQGYVGGAAQNVSMTFTLSPFMRVVPTVTKVGTWPATNVSGETFIPCPTSVGWQIASSGAGAISTYNNIGSLVFDARL